MTATPSTSRRSPLTLHEGSALLTGAEAMVKGVLETDVPVALVTGPKREPFAALFRLTGVEEIAVLLREHGTALTPTPDGRRALSLARHAAMAGRSAVTLVPNGSLDEVMPGLAATREAALPAGAGLVVVLADAPTLYPAACPRAAIERLGLTAVEPTSVGDLGPAMDAALRLSRAGGRPVAVVVHEMILQAAETIDVRPNRVLDTMDIVAGLRRRRGRVAEGGGDLRLARRLELNRTVNMPSPGERDPVGFIAVGPAAGTMRHLADVLGLVGRVAVLELRLVHPIDESLVGRFLTRFREVVVLEPRPGHVEDRILRVAETLRRRGERAAPVWGRELAPTEAGETLTLRRDDVVHPSILVRRIVHRLHLIRPTLRVASQLLPDAEGPALAVPARGAVVGSRAALARIRELVGEVADRLDHPDDEEGPPVELVIDEAPPRESDRRQVMVETWDHARFIAEGIPAVVQAARSGRPWLFIVLEQSGAEVSDLERLARSIVPAGRADRTRIETGNLGDPTALRATLTEAARSDRLTIVTVRDGPPPRFDVARIERELTEIDRLGFRPRQVLTWPADLACRVRPVPTEELQPRRVEAEAEPLRTEWTVERRRAKGRTRYGIMLEPVREQIVVTRERPPAWRNRTEFTERLPQPVPLHARQSEWRAHLAGFRGGAPGPAAQILCGAGRQMGYAVKCVWDPTPIGRGRRAWAQVLFTRPRRAGDVAPRSATIPYGEADVLLGLDTTETMRAVGPDPRLRVAFAGRTATVVNVGDLDGEGHAAEPEDSDGLRSILRPVTRAENRLVADVADACRTWFHTTRVTDVVLLGMAFQRGLIPVTPDAVEAAIVPVEAQGFGRLLAAFRFGRRLVEHPGLLRPSGREEDLDRLRRWMVLSIRKSGWGGRARAERFSGLLRRSLEGMPGLTETDPGRQARREFVSALYRCSVWGGLDYAERYADLVTALYRADRGDRGRALTRDAILPLAEVMLIRDGIFVSAMAVSPAQRRHLRRRLNVKRARGDRLERRYLIRAQAMMFDRRFRLDVRTGDWFVRSLAGLRRVVPRALRGSRIQRELREAVIGLIAESNHLDLADYDAWAHSLHRLHELALRPEFRGMRAATLRDLLTPPGSETPDAEADPDAAPVSADAST